MKGWLFIAAWAWPLLAFAEEADSRRAADYSVRNEVVAALDRGLDWLKRQQNPDGSWGPPQRAAITAWVLVDFLRQPEKRYARASPPDFLAKGFAVLPALVKPNAPSETIVEALIALLSADRPEDKKLASAAHDLLLAREAALPKSAPSDPAAAAVLLEGLWMWDAALNPIQKDVHRPAALRCLTRFQVTAKALRAENPAAADEGGFHPPSASPRLSHPNGSLTAAALLALLVNVGPDDARAHAGLAWLGRHYTLAEDPGAGPASCYRYLLSFAKALSVTEQRDFETAGRKLNWARAEALQLLDLQESDGSWRNKSCPPGAEESSPVLTTAYAVQALEIISHRLGE